jgi:hypothetical protein
VLPKAERFHAELVFVFLAVSTLFLITVHQMSMDGILPGNDPAVHLEKTKTIVVNKGVAYGEIPWYPPLFHVFLALLLLFVGTVDVMVASLVLKLVIATINVLVLLSTYLLARRLLGRGAAIASAVFTILSVPLFEMIFWGGYPNFLGITYIVLIFYIMNKNYVVSVKAFLLFLVSFALVLTHQLATFVFLLVFIPAFLIGTIRSKRKFLTFLAVVLGVGLAISAWYAEVILRYSSVLVSHIFFEMKKYFYSISYVSLNSLIKVFGAVLFLALAGIPLSFVLLRRRKASNSYPLLILWLAVPLFLSQSYLFGLYLPYERFIYFLATPIAIFAGATVCSLAKAPAFIASNLSSRMEKKHETLDVARVFTLAILVILFSFQGFLFLQRLQGLPQYYGVSGITGYNAGKWLKRYSVPDGAIVVSEKPGAWLGVISDHKTIEEANPHFGERNAVAEAVLYFFYEMENTRILTREYTSGGSISGQVMYVSVFNTWKKVLSIPDNYVYVNYTAIHDESAVTSLSDTTKKIYWTQTSVNKSQLVSEYSHELFTLEKIVTFYSESSAINLKWRFTVHQDLAAIGLKVFSFTEPPLSFGEAFVPGVLEWQNPWDKPSYVDTIGNWAMVECPPNNLSGNIAAMLDAENGMLVVFELADAPEWFNVGALGNHFIDALRVGYEFGNLMKDESREISFFILLYSFDSIDFAQWTQADLKQLLDSMTNLPVQDRDFLTYIKEYNIEFVVIDSQRLLLNVESSLILNRVYANNKFVVYAVRRAHNDFNLSRLNQKRLSTIETKANP